METQSRPATQYKNCVECDVRGLHKLVSLYVLGKFLGLFTQARNRVSGLLTSQLHDESRRHSWDLQSSSVQGENDRFASNRAAVNKVVNTIQIVTVATISGRIDFGSLNLGVPPGRGVTVPLGDNSAIAVSRSLWQRCFVWNELSTCEIGRPDAYY